MSAVGVAAGDISTANADTNWTSTAQGGGSFQGHDEHESFVYMVNDSTNTLFKIDKSDGSTASSTSIGSVDFREIEVDATGIYIITNDAGLYKYDTSLNQVWSNSTSLSDGGFSTLHLVLGDSVAIVRDEEFSRTVAFDKSTGDRAWITSDYEVFGGDVHSGTLLLGTDDGRLIEIDESDGSITATRASGYSNAVTHVKLTDDIAFIRVAGEGSHRLNRPDYSTAWTATGYAIEKALSPDGIIARNGTHLVKLYQSNGTVNWAINGFANGRHRSNETENYVYAKDSSDSVVAVDKFQSTAGEQDQYIVSGTVTDAGTNDGVENVDVEAYNDSTGALVESTATDSSGEYSLSLAGGTYDFKYSNAQYVTQWQNDTAINSATTINVELGDLGGTVTNNRTSNQVDGVTVDIFKKETIDDNVDVFIETPVASETTDSEGEWSVNVTDGHYLVQYSKAGFHVKHEEFEKSGIEERSTAIDPRRIQYTDASPRGSEYIRDRSSFTKGINITDPGSDSVTTTLYFLNESGEWEQFHQTSWSSSVSISTTFAQAVPGVNNWKAESETTRGTFNSSVYSYETPGDITVVKATDTSTTVTDAEITATIQSTESGFETTVVTPSDGGGGWTGEIDLNDVPREDLHVTLESTDGFGYETRTFVIDGEDIATRWSVAMVNSTTFSNEAQWYTQEFTLNDQSGEWSPQNTYLLLEQRVGSDFEVVAGGIFGAQNSVSLDVNDSEDYRITLLHAVRGDTRTLGVFEADRDLSSEVVELTVDETAPPQSGDSEGYSITAEITGAFDDSVDPVLTITFSDPEELTFDFNFTVHERGNTSNVLVEDSQDALGNHTFTYPLSDSQASTQWVVSWQAERDGDAISGEILVGGGTMSPGTQFPDEFKPWVSAFLILLVGAAFGGKGNARLGMLVMPMFAGVLFLAGWMSSNMTLGIVALALLIGGLIVAANYRIGD